MLKTYDKVLLYMGAIMAETCRAVLIIIYVFYCVSAFCSYIEDIFTVRKIHGMESFKTRLLSFKALSLSLSLSLCSCLCKR